MRYIIMAATLLMLIAPSVQAQDAAAMQDFRAGDKTMMANMQIAPSGDPDKDFVAMMLPHHQGAVKMAKTELRYGKDPELRALAQNIIAAQDKEIAQMQAWQKTH